MKFGAIKNLVGAVAPTIGAALGGPVGSAAAKVISQALGCKEDERSIEQAMSQASAEDLAKIREAELEFEAKMQQMEVDVFALETQDRQSARSHFAKDWTARALAISLMLLFATYIILVTVLPNDLIGNEATINLILGSITGSFSTVVAFYFGSSQKQDD